MHDEQEDDDDRTGDDEDDSNSAAAAAAAAVVLLCSDDDDDDHDDDTFLPKYNKNSRTVRLSMNDRWSAGNSGGNGAGGVNDDCGSGGAT